MIQTMTTAGPPIARRDVIITLAMGALTLVLVGWLQETKAEVRLPADPVPAFAALVYVAPLLWRRRYPLLAAGGTLAGLALHLLVFGDMTRCGAAIPELFFEAFAIATLLEGRLAALGLGVLAVSSVVMISQDTTARWGGLSIVLPGIAIVAAIGRVVRSRSQLVERLGDRNAELREARETNAALEVATDRVRLSAELDDLLRFRLADLAQLAEAGGGGDAPGTLRRIETESRATLEQMREVVGILRGDEAPGTEPQPTLTHLDALLLRAKGEQAKLRVTGTPRVLPPGLELSAYRVVEHLLAAMEDAPGVEVVLDFGDAALEVTVTGPARRRSEAAFERARERVTLQRGTLSTSSEDGRTRARAAFPVLVPA